MRFRSWLLTALSAAAFAAPAAGFGGFVARGPHPGALLPPPVGHVRRSFAEPIDDHALHAANLISSAGLRARGGRQIADVPSDQPSQHLSAPTPPPPPEQPQLPQSWQRCVQTQADFDLCLRESLQSILPQLVDGVPELSLPPLEPAELPGELVIPAQASRVHLSLALARMRAHGVTRAHIVSVYSDIKHGIIDIHAFIPYLLIEADFKAQGQILDEAVDAHGRVNISLHGVELFFGLQSALEERAKRTHLSVKSARVDLLSLQGLHALFEPLDPDPRRSEELNVLLDSESKALWSVLRERLQDALAAAFQHMAALLFDQVAVQEVFLDKQHPAVRRWQDSLLRGPTGRSAHPHAHVHAPHLHVPHALLRAPPPPWLFGGF